MACMRFVLCVYTIFGPCNLFALVTLFFTGVLIFSFIHSILYIYTFTIVQFDKPNRKSNRMRFRAIDTIIQVKIETIFRSIETAIERLFCIEVKKKRNKNKMVFLSHFVYVFGCCFSSCSGNSFPPNKTTS